MTTQSPHVVLLGDSIFDNAAYTRGEPDVVTHLRRLLPASWGATLCAVDGATTAGLARQIACVPRGASHLLVSIGGNDALGNMDLLSLRVTSSTLALEAFAGRLEGFEAAYRAAIDRVLGLRLPLAVCTIYNGALEAELAVAARVGVALFNDVILRTAVSRGIDAIELRSICTEPEDYANPIEPSGRGGLKIAQAIAAAVGALPPPSAPLRLWGNR